MPQFCPNYDDCDLKKRKKKVFIKIQTVFPVEIRLSPKKKVFTEIQTVFPIEITTFLGVIAMGSIKSMGPGDIVPPCPPLGGPEGTPAPWAPLWLRLCAQRMAF